MGYHTRFKLSTDDADRRLMFSRIASFRSQWKNADG